MKYKNILGKDFKSKAEAKKHFKTLLYSIKKPDVPIYASPSKRHVKLTEQTLIKHSHMEYLYNNYLTTDKKTLDTVFKGGIPYSWWCKINTDGTRNIAFEVETRNQSIIPVTPDRIFTCFGTAKINKKLNEKKVARHLISGDRDWYLSQFLEGDKNPVKIMFYKYECDYCNKFFPYKEIEVDHVVLFNSIFKEWRDNVWKGDLNPNSSCRWFEDAEPSNDGKIHLSAANDSWCQFHSNIVQYQKLCESCHTKKTYG
jgi:hypothetical protein